MKAEKKLKLVEESMPDYEAEFDAARAAFRAFLDGNGGETSATRRIVVLHDSDADGVAAGVILQLALERAGHGEVARVVPDRERNAWTESNRARVRACEPELLFVLDMGSSSGPVIEKVPTCFIDHHRPEGVPPDGVLISGYGWQPAVPNTSLLVYEVCREIAEVDDLEWIACIGTLSDLGERAPFDLVARAKKRYTAKWLKEATTLVNASRRSSHYDPEAAACALLAHDHPRALVESESQDVKALRVAREEVKAALDEGKKAAPVFSGRVALIRANTPCQIHPLIAQIWRTRLPAYVVIAANEGYLPGRVNFSARSSEGTNVLEFLRAIELEGEGGSYGHDQASGGSLPVARWNELLTKMGFSETTHAAQ